MYVDLQIEWICQENCNTVRTTTHILRRLVKTMRVCLSSSDQGMNEAR